MPAPAQTARRREVGARRYGLRARRRGRGRTIRLLRSWALGPLEVRSTGCRWRHHRTLELAAGTHREHRRRPTPVEDRHFTITVVSTPMAAGVRAENETGEEDDRDDEDD